MDNLNNSFSSNTDSYNQQPPSVPSKMMGENVPVVEHLPVIEDLPPVESLDFLLGPDLAVAALPPGTQEVAAFSARLNSDVKLFQSVFEPVMENATADISRDTIATISDTFDGFGTISSIATAAHMVNINDQVSGALSTASNIGVAGSLGIMVGLEILVSLQEVEKYKGLRQELAELQGQLATTTDPKTAEWLTKRIVAVEDNCKEVVNGAILQGLRAAISTSGTSANLLSSGAGAMGFTQASTALSIAGGSLGVAGAAVAVVYSGHSMYAEINTLKEINEEMQTLVSKLSDKSLDPSVVQIIELRLNRLEQQKHDAMVSIVQNGVTVGLAITGGTATAITLGAAIAGATLGGAATVSVASLGIGTAAIGGMIFVGGLGYAAYKNRKFLEISGKQAVVSLEKRNLKVKEKSKIKSKTKMEKLIRRNEVEISNSSKLLATRRAGLQTALNNVEVRITELSERMDPNLPQQLQPLFHRRNELQLKLKALEGRGIREIGETVDQHSKLTTNINSSSRQIQSIRKQTKQLKNKQQKLAVDKQINALAKQFSSVPENEVRSIATNLYATFTTQPKSKLAVKEYLDEQRMLPPDFDKEPVASVFQYLIKAV